jgi:hypothetical protein
MNLRRGLLRLYVAASIGWIAFTGFGSATCRGLQNNTIPFSCSPPLNFREHLKWVFAPVGVLVVGAALRWAAAGFRK